MRTVNIVPLPAWCRLIPKRLHPTPPPIFPEGEPTAEERALARELFEALDPESQEWYGRSHRSHP